MITIIGGGFSGLSAAYFLHRAGKDVTLLEWSRGLGGRASTRNVGYRTMDSGAQRIDLSPLSANQLETDARALLRAVAIERGILQIAKPFPAPVFRFDGRSLETAHQVEVPNWYFLDGGMSVFAESLVKDIPVRTHTRVSDIVFEKKGYTLRNQRGETMPSDGLVIALPAPYALAMLLPHAAKNKSVKRITDLFNEVNYEPMIGAMFGTTKIKFPEPFVSLYTDDITAPIFWLSQESMRRPLGIRKNEMAFVLQLGTEISREYVLKSDKETFVAVERVFEEVLDVALPDIIYGDIQRWPAAFLSSSPFTIDTIKEDDFKAPLYLAGDYVAGQSSIASAFWSGKQIADRIAGMDTFQFIEAPAREQARLGEEEWKAVVPPERKPRKVQKPQRKHAQKKFDKEKGKRVFVPAEKVGRKYGSKSGGAKPNQQKGKFIKKGPGGPKQGGWKQRPQGQGQGRPKQRGPQQFGRRPGPGQGQGQGQRQPFGQRQQFGQRQGQQFGGQRSGGGGRGFGGQQQGGGRGFGPQPARQRPARQWGGSPQGGRGQGGYGQQSGGYGQQGGGQGRPFGQSRPRPQGGGGYQPYSGGGGFNKPRPQREPTVYSTNVPQRQPRTSGYEGPSGPRRPRRPLDDDNIGNR